MKEYLNAQNNLLGKYYSSTLLFTCKYINFTCLIFLGGGALWMVIFFHNHAIWRLKYYTRHLQDYFSCALKAILIKIFKIYHPVHILLYIMPLIIIDFYHRRIIWEILALFYWFIWNPSKGVHFYEFIKCTQKSKISQTCAA